MEGANRDLSEENNNLKSHINRLKQKVKSYKDERYEKAGVDLAATNEFYETFKCKPW